MSKKTVTIHTITPEEKELYDQILNGPGPKFGPTVTSQLDEFWSKHEWKTEVITSDDPRYPKD